jgi:hypothetical protein
MTSCARGVPDAAVPLVDTAPVGAQQAARNLRWLWRLQAHHRLKLRGQRPVCETFEQGGGRAGLDPGAGQHPAQVLDHICPGPRALFLLGQRDCLLRRARQLDLTDDRSFCAVCARGRATGCGMPHRRRD